MKKRLIPLLLLTPLLLTSCGNEISLAKLRSHVDQIEKSEEHPYYRVIGSIDYNATVVEVNEEFYNQPKADTFVPYARYNEGFYNVAAQTLYDESMAQDKDIVIYAMASRSYWLRAPMKIDKDNFYVLKENNSLNSTCAYANLIKIIATWYGTTNNPSSKKPYYEIHSDGSFAIGGKEIHTVVKIDNFPIYPDPASHPGEISEWDEDDPLPLYMTESDCKVNIRFEYDKDGWLKREVCTTIGYDYKKTTAGQFSLESRYFYQNETEQW